MKNEIKQLQLIKFSEPEDAVELTFQSKPVLKDDEVLVAMEAAPIHLSDFSLIRGIYGVKPTFPAPLGGIRRGPGYSHRIKCRC